MSTQDFTEHMSYPQHTSSISEALHQCQYSHSTTTPVFKLFNEICQNKLSFEVSSPSGILLFKDISQLVQRYGNREEEHEGDVYTVRLKGMTSCFRMLRSILAGNYVNFGVFKIYNDPCLQEALNMFVSLVLSVPDCHLMDYPKLKNCYFGMVETLAEHHCEFLTNLDPPVLKAILQTISEAISSLDWVLAVPCCLVLDNLATHLFKRLSKPHSLNFDLQLLQPVLIAILRVVVFEECRNLWALSRPLLILIILNEHCFKQFTSELAHAQKGQKSVHACFEGLMKGIEVNVNNKNRDRFTLNLSGFKQEIQEALRHNQAKPAPIQ